MRTVYNPLEKQIQESASLAEDFEYKIKKMDSKNFCSLVRIYSSLSKIFEEDSKSKLDFLSKGLISDESRSLLLKTMGSINKTLADYTRSSK